MLKIKLTPVVRDILAINIILFIISRIGILDRLLLFPIDSEYFNPFQYITYMFMHVNFVHILFNMMMFIFLGPSIEKRIGHRRFLYMYIIAGIGSALLHFYMVDVDKDSALLGASGSVFAILTGYGFLFPDRKLSILLLPFQFKAKYLSICYFTFELYRAFTSVDNVSHWGHIGGGIVGFIYLYHLTKIKKL